MKPDLKLMLILPAFLLSGCWDKQPSQEAKEDAKVIAEGMQIMRDATNAQGDDRLSDGQIKKFENTLAGLMDEDNRKSAMCGVIIMEVQNLISAKNMPKMQYKMADQMEEAGRQFGAAEAAELAADMRKEARQMEIEYRNNVDNIVIGSLRDWLFQMGLKSLEMFGATGNNEAYKALHHECMQKPFEAVMNPDDKMKHH